MEIIIDRKKKRKYLMMDESVSDPLGIEEIKKDKANTIEIPKNSEDVVDKFILNNSIESLKGKMVYALKKGADEVISGKVVKILVDRILLLRQGKRLIPVNFDSVISIGD